MGKILESYINTLSRQQARKIEDELKKNSGGLIRTPLEFRDAFQQELRTFLSQNEEIRFKVLPQNVGTIRDSESISWSMRTLASDLEVLGIEADLLHSMSDLEIDTMKEEILNKLRAAVGEAKSEIERLELIRGNTSGLSDAIVDDFRDNSNRLPRADPFSHYLYVDPKTSQQIEPELDAVAGNGITLPINSSLSITPSSIKEILNSDVRSESERLFLAGGGTPSSTGSAMYAGQVSNIIDKRTGTFWTKALVTEDKISGGALSTLEISLGQTSVEVNFIQIEAAALEGQILDSVFFIDQELYVRELTMARELILNDRVNLTFNTISAVKVVCVLRQKNYFETVNRLTSKTARLYRFGLDNILFGKASYRQSGYYISSTLSMPQISKVFLSSMENTKRLNHEINRDVFDMPTVEYWISAREIDGSENVIQERLSPILPVGRLEVVERILVDDNDASRAMFSVDPTIANDSEEFTMYRNGSEVLRDNDYSLNHYAPTPGLMLEDRLDISIPQGYNRQDNFCAVYTPLFMKEGIAPIPFRDPSGYMSYNTDGSIGLRRSESSRAVRTDVNLIIILRGSGNSEDTPIIDSYTLAVG
jgi:hypothetical protein